MLQNLQGKFPYFYPAEEPMLSCAHCTALTVVCAYSYVLGILLTYLHSMLTWFAFSKTFHMYTVQSKVLTSTYVTCTIHSTSQNTYGNICIPQHLLSFVYFVELTVLCILHRT